MDDQTTKREIVIARYADGPNQLETAISGLSEEDLDIVGNDCAWTIRQIVHHVVDGDDLWKTCIKMALGNEQAEFSLEWYWAQPQEVWAKNWAYENRSLDVSLALLKANRSHIQQLLGQVPDGWHRSVIFRKSNGETERMPVGAVVEIQADHVEHHVKQIRAIRSEVGGV